MTMKKLVLILAIVIGIFSMPARDSYTHDINVLPAAAQTIPKNNFKSEVNHIKIEKDWGRVSEYDVILSDGSEITFDTAGNWKDIEVKRTASVPDSFIPQEIATYVKQNQKNAKITGIEKNRSGYEIELSNGVDMKFNKDGKFLRYDN